MGEHNLKQSLLCGCQSCIYHEDGVCRAVSVVFDAPKARCRTYARQAEETLMAEFARELAPQRGRVLCAKRTCAHNDALYCKAERIEVVQKPYARCFSYLESESKGL